MSTRENIDPDGDLVLAVGPKGQEFKVSRVALRLASPVFKAMLTGRFAEATASVVQLRDDDAVAMRYLLLVTHLQFRKVPTTMTLGELATLAKLCDKYDCATVVEDRISVLVGNNSMDWSYQDAVRCLWIGWIFRHKDCFANGYRLIVHRTAPAKSYALPDLPLGCKDFILEGITSGLDSALKEFYRIIDKELPNTAQCTKTEATQKAQQSCLFTRTGAFVQLASRLDIQLDRYPRSGPFSLRRSKREMVDTAINLHDEVHNCIQVSRGVSNHKDCCGSLDLIVSSFRQLVLWKPFEKFPDNIKSHFGSKA